MQATLCYGGMLVILAMRVDNFLKTFDIWAVRIALKI